MKKKQYRFPLAIQTTLPENYREESVFQQQLQLLQDFGFSGVELNIANPAKADITDLQDFLGQFDLTMTMLASGLTAKTFKLSLSANNETIRKKSVTKCHEMIDFVAGTDAGIIIGFLKGGQTPDMAKARELFAQSLAEIAPYAATKQVKLLIEATNHQETAIANTVAEAVGFIEPFNNPFLRVLPDTYHMALEENSDWEVLRKYSPYFDSLHLSDDNRYFPGLGSIQFDVIIDALKSMNYQGGIAIEGNIKDSFAADIKASMEYLIPLIS